MYPKKYKIREEVLPLTEKGLDFEENFGWTLVGVMNDNEGKYLYHFRWIKEE